MMNLATYGINLLVICIVLISISTFGQTARFKNFGNQEGFTAPGGHRTFSQDSLGFLWIGTGRGLYRFDGYAFKVYKRDPEDSLSIYKEGADWMHVDPTGRLWLLYGDRLQRYDRDLDGFVTYEPAVGGKGIRSLFFIGEEGIWIGSTGKGLFYFDLKTNNTTNYVNESADSVLREKRNYIYDIEQRGSVLLLGTQDGLWKFDLVAKSFGQPKWSKADSLIFADPKGNWINGIFTHTNHYWISSAIGLIKLDTNFVIVKKLDVQKAFQSIDNSKTGSVGYGVAQDAEGIFWISSRGLGLVQYDPQTDQLINFRHNPSDINSLASDLLVGVFVDKDQNVWLGSFDKGISQLNKFRIKVYNYLGGVPLSGLTLVPGEQEDNLFVASIGRGLWMSPLSLSSFNSLHFQSISLNSKIGGFDNLLSVHNGQDRIWVSSFSDGVVGIPFDKHTGLPGKGPALLFQQDARTNNLNAITSDQTTELLEDGQGNLWVGTMGFGLNKVVLSKSYREVGSVLQYAHDDQDSTSMIKPGWISGLCIEDDSSVWVSTYGGLELFRNGHFEHIYKNVEGTFVNKTTDGSILFGTKSGLYEGRKEKIQYQFKKVALPNDPFIWTAMQDDLGRLWISTGEGLFCLDRKEQVLLQFDELDGIIGNRRGVQTRDGLMAFSGPDGISIFDPKSVQISKTKPRPVITILKVNNKIILSNARKPADAEFLLPQSIHTLTELVLDHTQNMFSLEFAAMQLTSPQNNLYEYKLEGFDPDWINTDWKDRTATYTNLDPGTYLFKVKASNQDGIWSDYEKTLKVIILPPPWLTWWAYTGYGLLAVGLLLLARKSVVQRERLKSSLRLEQVEREKEHFEFEKAKEVDRVKSSFFTNISHEFRTPLTLIKGPVETLLDRFKDDPDVIKRLKLVQRNSDLLLRLINQLLDLAKLESGSLKVEKSEGEVNGFIRAVASSFESLARQKNVSLVVDVPAGQEFGMFDKDKVETVVINLVNNAIKFTPSGGKVVVSSQRQLTAEAQGRRDMLCLKIADTGIGIPQDQQSKIFERFHQVSEAHKEVGTGIGLSLVKELVNLMGGTITVKSEPGKGSEFTVHLPIEFVESYRVLGAEREPVPSRQLPDAGGIVEDSMLRATNTGQRTTVTSSEEDSSSKPQVLVVEDNADLRAFIIDSLGTEFHFLEAENGKIGLDTAIEHIPDLIISDVMMPEMDGMEMTKEIKSDIKTSHIPLILLTAKSSEESKLTGLQSGADDYLTKPFNRQEVLLKVRNGVSRQLKLREKLRNELMTLAPKVEVMSADEQFLDKVKTTILEQMSDEQLSVESLAEDIGMSRVQLYRKVSGLTGMAVNELIRKLRLQRAAQLLGQEWGPVSQVAYEVGFSNLSYFSKVFKEEFGVLPSEYVEK